MSKIPKDGSWLPLSHDNAVTVTSVPKSDCGQNDLSELIPIAAIHQAVAGQMFRDDSLGVSRHSFIPALISR